jgi:hypothetical protein
MPDILLGGYMADKPVCIANEVRQKKGSSYLFDFVMGNCFTEAATENSGM